MSEYLATGDLGRSYTAPLLERPAKPCCSACAGGALAGVEPGSNSKSVLVVGALIVGGILFAMHKAAK